MPDRDDRQPDDPTAAVDAAVVALAERLTAVASDLPDPDRAEADVRRFLAVDGDDPVASAQRLLADPLALERLLQLTGTSRWAMQVVLRRPAVFWAVVDDRQFRDILGRRTLAAQLASDLVTAGDPVAHRSALMCFKERHYIRLLLGDIAGDLRLEAVVAELSDLTDVLVDAALDLARAALPAPALPVGFAVIGMGKLGARELNYSSDIDLIFLYDDPPVDTGGIVGDGRPDEDSAPRPGAFDRHAYACRLGTALIRILDESTSDGRLFRVDMRLRPEGDRGELALSRRETRDYYYSVGRPWERQAMIKARAIAGELALGVLLLDELRPWIFPRERWQDLDQTRAMRRRIEERRVERDIKTGAGGIRDIEFLVQFQQLQHGGAIPELRPRATLPVLRALADRGLLPRAHAGELERHYLWLRLVEHRLQVWEDRQIHELPVSGSERAALARRCGLRGSNVLAAFDQRMHDVRARVRSFADRHYLNASPRQDAIIALLTQDAAEPLLAAEVLGAVGFKDLAQAAKTVRALAAEPFFVLSRSRTEKGLATLLPALLDRIAASPDPDECLANVARIVGAVGGRATFYELLAVRPAALRLVVDLAGWSTFLVGLLQQFPGLPDDLIDSLNQPARNAGVLVAESRMLIRGLSDPAPPLAHFQARELAATAVRDLDGLPQAQVCRQLSDLAGGILMATVERLLLERTREWGAPVEEGRRCRFAVLGLGKLGGGELSYASDMDVVFVCDPGGSTPSGQSGEQFFTRIAHELVRHLGEARIYDVDPRLRPWGDQGELVSSLPALEQYWGVARDLWERMAMLRVAHIAGEPSLGETAVALIRERALRAPLPTDAAFQVRDMRRRLEESVGGRDHLKRGWGGYVDHEFIAHFRSFGLLPADLPVGAAIATTLTHLGALGRIPVQAAEELTRGLAFLRLVEARMRLTAGKAVSSIPQGYAQRVALARRCGASDLATFDLELHLTRERARGWFEHLVR